MSQPEFIQRITSALRGVRAGDDCDVLLYNGPIDRTGFYEVCKHSQPEHDTLILILTTAGGDPHAAFRIARVLGDRYKRIEALIGGPCKSAGTLVVMGADVVVLADEGELGPLDIQLRRSDEPLEAESGLDVTTSLGHLLGSAVTAWESAFTEIQIDSQLSTRACADLANSLIAELYGKLFAQIDPVRLGAVIRANTIATRYGNDLAEMRKNLKTSAVQDLVLRYPAHGFSIDRREAAKLFNNVRAPTNEEIKLLKTFEDAVLEVRRTEKSRVISRLDSLLDEVHPLDDAADGRATTGTDAQPATGSRRDHEADGKGAAPHKSGASDGDSAQSVRTPS